MFGRVLDRDLATVSKCLVMCSAEVVCRWLSVELFLMFGRVFSVTVVWRLVA